MLEAAEGGGVRLIAADTLRAHEDVLRWVTRHRGRNGCILVVNAPIIVTNMSGARPCDKLVQEHFARFKIDEVANNIVSASHPRTMGSGLMRMGFDPDPGAEGDRIVETHTQSAQIMMFGLDRPVRMKTGPIGGRKESVARMRELIGEVFMQTEPVLHVTPELDQLLDAHLPDLNGTRIGELEEKIEALLCAWIGAWLGIRGPEACAFLGDLDRGYVLLPDPGRTQQE